MLEADMDITIIIVHLLDNNVYMVNTPGGEKRLPTKRSDGQYHVEGQPSVVGREVVKDLICVTVLIMKAGGEGECRKIILSPLSRYTVKKADGNFLNYRKFPLPSDGEYPLW
jgi:hypothetical protein